MFNSLDDCKSFIKTFNQASKQHHLYLTGQYSLSSNKHLRIDTQKIKDIAQQCLIFFKFSRRKYRIITHTPSINLQIKINTLAIQSKSK